MSRLSLLLLTGGCAGPTAGLVPQEREASPARTLDPGCVGSAYATVQSAIDAAVTGDVVEICAGLYQERLTVSSAKTITLRSANGAASTIIDATWGGRALSVSGGASVTVEGLTFVNGVSTTGNGGDVRCTGADLVIRDSVLADGTAVKGGGLAMSTCTGLVERNTFRDDHATDRGGGLHVSGTVDLLGNTFETCSADVYGGGAYLKDSFALVQGNTVIGNTSRDDGAGVYVANGAPTVDGNWFEANDSDEEAGALRIKTSEAVITGNTFVDNHADWRGGAMKISHDESVLSGNTYIGNTAWGDGGAVLLYESASDLSFETYRQNEADRGGAIAIIAGWDGPHVEDGTFDGNEARLGGHLYVSLLARTVKLRRVDLVEGEADEGGAVYAVAGSDLDLRNVLFAGNAASVGGGAVSIDQTTGEIYNSVAIWNDAPTGAGLRVTNGGAFKVKNTAFTQNTGGAAIGLVSGAAPTVRYDDFDQNASDFSGMATQVGIGGNLAVPTGFTDALTRDYTLQPASALRDAGDPAMLDPDGTRSDIGLYGGPYAF